MSFQQFPSTPSLFNSMLTLPPRAGPLGGYTGGIPIAHPAQMGFPIGALDVHYGYLPALRLDKLSPTIPSPHALAFTAPGSPSPRSAHTHTPGPSERDSPNSSSTTMDSISSDDLLSGGALDLATTSATVGPTTGQTGNRNLPDSAAQALAQSENRPVATDGGASRSRRVARAEPRGKKPDESFEQYEARRDRNNKSAKESRDRQRERIAKTIACNKVLNAVANHRKNIIEDLEKRLGEQKAEIFRLRKQLEADRVVKHQIDNMDAVLMKQFEDMQKELQPLCGIMKNTSSLEKLGEMLEVAKQVRRGRNDLLVHEMVVMIKPEPNGQPEPQ